MESFLFIRLVSEAEYRFMYISLYIQRDNTFQKKSLLQVITEITVYVKFNKFKLVD